MKKFQLSWIKLICCLGMISVIGCGESEKESTDNVLPALTIGDVTLLEGNGPTTFIFEVTMSKVSTEVVTFRAKTYTGTAGDADFDAVDSEFSILAGETKAEIPVNIVFDEIREQDEQFEVRLSNVSGATISDNQGIGTIKNEDTFIDKGTDGYTTPAEYDGYVLNWSDEFDGDVVNTDIWGYNIGDNGWGNNELQNYTNDPKNSFLEDGNLIIEAIKEDGDITSARLLTQDKQEYKFGRIDVRAKLPEGQGIWPAIWMLGSNIDDVSWPACGELDIMELVGHKPNEVHGTAHWGNAGSPSIYNGRTTIKPEGFQEVYHVFSLVWTTSKVEWLVDEEIVHTITPTNTTGYNYPFNQDFFMILNVAVGGNWPGYPDETTVFPQRMTVDYVRVFQRI